MNLKEFRYVMAVSEAGSLSKAAQQLYISQPALSKFIKSLEDYLHIQIFDRIGNRLVLTESGQIYLEAASMIVDIYDKMERRLKDADNLIYGRVRIGITTFRGSHLLPKVLPVFCERYPNIEINLFEESADILERLLSNGDVDAVIIKMPIISPNFTCIPLYSEEVLLSVHPDHPAVKHAVEKPGNKYPWIDLKLLDNELFILLKSGQRTRLISENILRDVGVMPKRVIQTNNVETALRLSAAGMGVSFIPELYAVSSYYTDMPLFFSVGAPKTTSEFVFAYRKDSYLTNATKEFISIVTEYYRSSQPLAYASKEPDTE